MKHLKSFNESVDKDKLLQLKDFCENYLAYLIDDDFIIAVKDSYFDRRDPWSTNKELKGNYQNNEAIIIIKHTDSFFKWDSVSDSILPFLQMLSKQYSIKHNKIAFRNTYHLGWSSKKSDYTLDQLLKGVEVDDSHLKQIELRVRL